jgi:xylan 1,4-beta-xylosidase
VNRKLNSKRKKHRKYMIGGVTLITLTFIVMIGVSQLDKIRQFFSQASGQEANLVVDTQAVLGPMPRPWRYLAQGGEDHAWRLGGVTPQVAALNPEYIRLDHIYDFYDIVQGTPGNITFDFSKFDLILNDILAAGAKPYIALSYMPPAISSGDITSPPVNWYDWQLTIQKTIEHVSGTRRIVDVYYEVWNEPDLFGGWKYYGERNYLNLYTYAARGADNARGVQRFKLGGPAITALYQNWFDALAKHAIDNNLRYDFFSWHRYTTDIEQFNKDMDEVQLWIQDYPQLEPTLEFHISEWGHDSENNIGYDNGYSAAHTVAGAIEMVPKIQKAFVFEIQDGKDPAGQALWGRWGLFGHNDFGANPKPRYWGLKMLDRIADQRLQITGKGSWVKALAAKNESNNTEVIMVNYDPRGRHSEQVPVTFQNIVPGKYTVNIQNLNGRRSQQQIATDSAIIRTEIPMAANNMVFLELIRAGQ